MAIEQVLNTQFAKCGNNFHRSCWTAAWWLALLGLVALTTACGRRAAPPSESAGGHPVTVRVQKPERVRRAVRVAASGTVEATETVDLAFQVAGRVARVLVDEGQRVRRGDLIAELDATDYRYGLDAAEGQAGVAQATREKAQTGTRAEELEQAKAGFARAEDEYSRYRQLFERKSLAPADFAKVEAAYRAAKAQLEMAQNGARKEDRSAADATVRQAQAQVNLNRKRVADTRLTSPIDGVVARRSVDPGEMAGAGMPLFTIVALNPARVRVGIPEADVATVHNGQRASVVIPSLQNREFPGTVELVGVAADPNSRTFTAKISVPNPSLTLKAGMIAEASIEAAGTVDALVIPGEAVVHDAQGATLVYVYFPQGHRAHARRVEAGPVLGRGIEIASGLSPDDLLVVAGQQKLREGSPVEVAR